MVKTLEFFELNTGAKIPSIGLGTFDIQPYDIEKVLTTAIKVGYRHFDCAPLYGNQVEVGNALKKIFNDGLVKREDLWITSKLWCADHDPEDVPKALDKTLEQLQLDYIDLYLIHFPVSLKKGSLAVKPENFAPLNIPNTWKAMEKLYDCGKARAIGVSNFSSKKLQFLLDIARVLPAVNQVELHPVFYNPKLHALSQSSGVHLSGYSPLGVPGKFKRNLLYNGLNNPVVKKVSEKLGKTPAQVALRWGLQMGNSVIMKTSNEIRLKENFDIFDWFIPQDLIAIFSEIHQARLYLTESCVHEIYSPYKTLEELWDGEL